MDKYNALNGTNGMCFTHSVFNYAVRPISIHKKLRGKKVPLSVTSMLKN